MSKNVEVRTEFADESGDEERGFRRSTFENGEEECYPKAVPNEDSVFGKMMRSKLVPPRIQCLSVSCGELWNDDCVMKGFKFSFEPREPILLRIAIRSVDDDHGRHDSWLSAMLNKLTAPPSSI